MDARRVSRSVDLVISHQALLSDAFGSAGPVDAELMLGEKHYPSYSTGFTPVGDEGLSYIRFAVPDQAPPGPVQLTIPAWYVSSLRPVRIPALAVECS
jgi:hypothetical protein